MVGVPDRAPFVVLNSRPLLSVELIANDVGELVQPEGVAEAAAPIGKETDAGLKTHEATGARTVKVTVNVAPSPSSLRGVTVYVVREVATLGVPEIAPVPATMPKLVVREGEKNEVGANKHPDTALEKKLPVLYTGVDVAYAHPDTRFVIVIVTVKDGPKPYMFEGVMVYVCTTFAVTPLGVPPIAPVAAVNVRPFVNAELKLNPVGLNRQLAGNVEVVIATPEANAVDAMVHPRGAACIMSWQ